MTITLKVIIYNMENTPDHTLLNNHQGAVSLSTFTQGHKNTKTQQHSIGRLTSDRTTLMRNRMWNTVLESADIFRQLSRKPCSEDSSLLRSLLQNKVSSLEKVQGALRTAQRLTMPPLRRQGRLAVRGFDCQVTMYWV